MTFGKTRNDAKSGVAERRVAVDQKGWFVVQNDGLRIISDELWGRVERRRRKTNQTFVRNQQGQLHGRPESGLVSKHLMNGVGRCFECGGPLIFVHRGGKHAHRERLVAALATGSKSAAVIDEITKREAAIEALKVTPQAPRARKHPGLAVALLDFRIVLGGPDGPPDGFSAARSCRPPAPP